jgi:Rps23 Pro-64 3,4-dihydroxylase Tpa1-like proline 4-hydroxylase
VEQLSSLFSINLEIDPFRHYWGIHKYRNGDYLNIHVDAGIHPKNKKKKHLTLGLYLSKNWKEENHGHLELWTGDTANLDSARIFECKKSILPIFNRLLLFECTDNSWHGNPVPVNCTLDETRIFVTISYLSTDMNFLNKRERAFFVPRPNETYTKEMNELRLIRADKNKYKNAYRTL